MAVGTSLGAGHFVGRDQELALVDRACELAVGGRRQLVVVSGPPGIGKTRLCERAAATAEAAGFTVVWGRCWPHGGAPALWPWPAVLAELVGEDAARLLSDDSGREEVDPERFARFAAVAARLVRDRGNTPTMVVIDDVHSADEGALLLTRF
ncbi:MAG: AAA family ATPase, partial [Gammaproteobacteria bacterium]